MCVTFILKSIKAFKKLTHLKPLMLYFEGGSVVDIRGF